MAATIARATGHDNGRSKETHRLGSQWAEAEAATWRTFATVTVSRDGSGTFRLRRSGKTLLQVEFESEDGPSASVVFVMADPEVTVQ